MCRGYAPTWQARPCAATIVVFVAAGLMFISVPEASSQTTRVSMASNGTQGNNISQQLTMTPDARLVSFFSYANNLVPVDTNGRRDVFVHNRATHTTSLVSVSSTGLQGNGEAGYAQLSADGTTVVFAGGSDNLVPADGNHAHDIFVRDLLTGTTTMVSVSSTGQQGNRRSRRASISGDGRFVAFRSDATNLVPGDTNGKTDIFLHDRQTHTTTRVSVASDGTQANDDTHAMSISADGQLVAFDSYASNLVSDDTNGTLDVFVHEPSTGETTRVNVADDGTQADAGWSQIALWNSLSATGRYVTFFSEATNLVPGDTNGFWDIFVRDRLTHTTTRVSVASDGSEANGISIRSSVSNDGRFVVFSSAASNLVPGDTNGFWDIFVHDRLTGATTRRSLADDGSQANYQCWLESAVSTDGETVAFFTGASNIVPRDTNNRGDIFVSELFAQPVQAIPTVGTVGGVIFLIALSVAGLWILHGRHGVSTETVYGN